MLKKQTNTKIKKGVLIKKKFPFLNHIIGIPMKFILIALSSY